MPSPFPVRRCLSCLLLALCHHGGAIAQPAAPPADAPFTAARLLPPAQGKVLLTLGGQIEVRNEGARAALDDAMLAALPQHSFTTRTPWDKAPRQFSGPLLRDVLQLVRAHGSELAATALNDYHATIPVSDAYLFDMLIARRIDGQPVRVRDRGPLLLVYPYDRDSRLSERTYVARSVWQLQRLDVR